ncbi:MAG: AmmeMemoRadiSam system protein B [Lentisphaeraceae bacterium]|nr:AmmeMemoRadiSam system protein B [Lentisphaeraceae bacterium]
MSSIRKEAVAGSFYPGNKSVLQADIGRMLQDVDYMPVHPKAMIVPHAGYIYSGPIAASAYAQLKNCHINHVVLIGPSHFIPIVGMALSSDDYFSTPLGNIAVNVDENEKALEFPFVEINDDAHFREHSLEVQLPFLQSVLGEFSITPILVGNTSPSDVAKLLEALWGGEETLILISSDLSHYLPYETAQKMDSDSCNKIAALEVDSLGPHMACGSIGVQGLMTVAEKRKQELKLIDQRNSGDTAGDRSQVVGYASFLYLQPYEARTVFSLEEKLLLLELVRNSIAHELELEEVRHFKDMEFAEREAATFVTLKYEGKLRGCIGTLQAHRTLRNDLFYNAKAAAFEDPRFDPLTVEELGKLTIHISVLSEPRHMKFRSEEDLLRQLQPGKDGLILCDGMQCGTFLPSVWDELPEPHMFLRHLKLKAGIDPDRGSESFDVRRYRATSFGN